MKSLLFALIFPLVFCASVFSQTNQTLPCPTIDVIGPAGVILPNKLVIFTASISKEAENYKIEYEWLISSGEIVEGQRTSIIKVLQKNIGETLTATVKINGLPESCSNSDSETTPICSCVESRIIDEFSVSVTQINKSRLNYLGIELQNDPNAVAYIIEKFKKNISQKSKQQKMQKIINYLEREKGIKRNRIIISTTVSDKNSTQLWIVPSGASFPIIEDNN